MKETVTVKKSISLYVADTMLEALYCNANDLMNDPEYARRFNYLQYVNSRLDEGVNDLEINDIYMAFECTPIEPPAPVSTIGANKLRDCCAVATTGANDVRQ